MLNPASPRWLSAWWTRVTRGASAPVKHPGAEPPRIRLDSEAFPGVGGKHAALPAHPVNGTEELTLLDRLSVEIPNQAGDSPGKALELLLKDGEALRTREGRVTLATLLLDNVPDGALSVPDLVSLENYVRFGRLAELKSFEVDVDILVKRLGTPPASYRERVAQEAERLQVPSQRETWRRQLPSPAELRAPFVLAARLEHELSDAVVNTEPIRARIIAALKKLDDAVAPWEQADPGFRDGRSAEILDLLEGAQRGIPRDPLAPRTSLPGDHLAAVEPSAPPSARVDRRLSRNLAEAFFSGRHVAELEHMLHSPKASKIESAAERRALVAPLAKAHTPSAGFHRPLKEEFGLQLPDGEKAAVIHRYLQGTRQYQQDLLLGLIEQVTRAAAGSPRDALEVMLGRGEALTTAEGRSLLAESVMNAFPRNALPLPDLVAAADYVTFGRLGKLTSLDGEVDSLLGALSRRDAPGWPPSAERLRAPFSLAAEVQPELVVASNGVDVAPLLDRIISRLSRLCEEIEALEPTQPGLRDETRRAVLAELERTRRGLGAARATSPRDLLSMIQNEPAREPLERVTAAPREHWTAERPALEPAPRPPPEARPVTAQASLADGFERELAVELEGRLRDAATRNPLDALELLLRDGQGVQEPAMRAVLVKSLLTNTPTNALPLPELLALANYQCFGKLEKLATLEDEVDALVGQLGTPTAEQARQVGQLSGGGLRRELPSLARLSAPFAEAAELERELSVASVTMDVRPIRARILSELRRLDEAIAPFERVDPYFKDRARSRILSELERAQGEEVLYPPGVRGDSVESLGELPALEPVTFSPARPRLPAPAGRRDEQARVQEALSRRLTERVREESAANPHQGLELLLAEGEALQSGEARAKLAGSLLAALPTEEWTLSELIDVADYLCFGRLRKLTAFDPDEVEALLAKLGSPTPVQTEEGARALQRLNGAKWREELRQTLPSKARMHAPFAQAAKLEADLALAATAMDVAPLRGRLLTLLRRLSEAISRWEALDPRLRDDRSADILARLERTQHAAPPRAAF